MCREEGAHSALRLIDGMGCPRPRVLCNASSARVHGTVVLGLMACSGTREAARLEARVPARGVDGSRGLHIACSMIFGRAIALGASMTNCQAEEDRIDTGRSCDRPWVRDRQRTPPKLEAYLLESSLLLQLVIYLTWPNVRGISRLVT